MGSRINEAGRQTHTPNVSPRRFPPPWSAAQQTHLLSRVCVPDEIAKGRQRHRRASRHCGRDYRSADVVASGVAVEPIRPSANKSQRRVSSKNCSLTLGSF